MPLAEPVQRKPKQKTFYDRILEIKQKILHQQKTHLDEQVKNIQLQKTKVRRVVTTLFKGAGRSIGRALGGFRGVGRSISSLLG